MSVLFSNGLRSARVQSASSACIGFGKTGASVGAPCPETDTVQLTNSSSTETGWFSRVKRAWNSLWRRITQHPVVAWCIGLAGILGVGALTASALVGGKGGKMLSAGEIQSVFEKWHSEIPYHWTIYGEAGIRANAPLSVVAKDLEKARRITLGDLHGHYQKLAETLLASKLVTMSGKQTETFSRLAREFDTILQQDPGLSRHLEDARKLCRELQQTIRGMKWIGGDRQLFLIGDVIADRGPADTLTLEILEHLERQRSGSIVTFASNHDYAALQSLINDGTSMLVPVLPFDQQDSMVRAFKLAAGPAERDALKQRYVNYLSKQKLWHFEPQSGTFYSHAPITRQDVARLITRMVSANRLPASMTYERLTKEALPDFIDNANAYYQHHVRQALQQNKINPADLEVMIGRLDDGLLWRRSKLDRVKILPFYGKGVLRFVHGHDQLSKFSPYWVERRGTAKKVSYQIINLDQAVRKGSGLYSKDASTLYLGV